MADQELRTTVKIVDDASAPLKKIAESAKQATKAAQESAKTGAVQEQQKDAKTQLGEIAKATEAFRAQVAVIRELGAATVAAKHAIDGLVSAEMKQLALSAKGKKPKEPKAPSAPMAPGVGGGAAGYGKTIAFATMATAALGYGQAVYQAAESLVRYAAATADAFHHSVAQLEMYTQSREAAKQLTKEVQALGVNTGMGADAAVDMTRRLMQLGIRGEELRKTLAGAADLKAMGWNGDALVGIQKQLLEFRRSTGAMGPNARMSGTKLAEMFESTGLDRMTLARSLGFQGGEEQLNMFFATMSISADKGMKAIYRAIADAGGKENLGDKSAEMVDESVTGQWNKLKEAFDSITKDVDWTPLSSALQSIRENMLTPANVAAMRKAFEYLVAGLTILSFMGEGLVIGIRDLTIVLGSLPENLQMIGRAITDWWTGVQKWWTEGVDAIGHYLAGAPARWGAAFDDAVAGFVSAGANLMAGFWKGLKEGWAKVSSWFTDSIASIPASMRKILGIASPSKVTFALGKHTAAGFEGGLREGTDAVERAAQGLAAAPVTGIAAGTQPAAPADRSIVVNVNWTASDRLTASDRAEWEAMAAQVFREIALQGA